MDQNVNKAIFRAVKMSLKGAGNPGMINIGTCNLHVVHNSFCKALEAYVTPVDDLAVDIKRYHLPKERISSSFS